MSAIPAPVAPVSPASSDRPSIKPGQVLIVGKLIAARRPESQGQLWVHLLVMPAPDSYSSPQTVEIQSKRRLGEKEEELRVLCRVGGFRSKPRQVTDQDTGEVRTIQGAFNKLYAVED